MLNLLETNGNLTDRKFIRFWILCNLMNAGTLFLLVAAVVSAVRWAW